VTKYSQNGYVACDSSLIGKFTIPGSTITINLRKGDVSVVLLDFLSWHHKNIESLRQKDTGGYNCRNIAGSTKLSNHASGTAADVRWQEHVQGKRNAGFSAAEVSKINTKLKEYGGAIRWGNNYSGTPDAMHFEINQGPALVKKQADRIRARNAKPAPSKPPAKPATGLPVHAPGSRTLKQGVSPGTDVQFVQRFIGPKHMGPPDGVPGPQFAAGVKWWQGMHFGWNHPDGVLTKGGQSWHAMGH